ncbi:hypothetical protein FYK55_20390 [Roseiconus nitratireducens]|uniref:Uncharacterized protein n=2 Tax=Roseiconus nitratireducens TaxID=2605748 RepID=A0A5M6CZV3_9BACT|nr:hypothetical protein FYK55_20390 [Roseiconus nitratireducens]
MIRSTCEPYEQLKEQDKLERQGRREGRRVWATRYASQYANNACRDEVKQGFVTAYAETALGGNGCPPPMPTSPLLSRHTLTHTYPAAVPWYEGYHLGHASAVAHGVDKWRLAPIDPDLIAAACACRPMAGHPVLPAYSEIEVETIPGDGVPIEAIPAEAVPAEGVPAPVPAPETIDAPQAPSDLDTTKATDSLPSYITTNPFE